MRNNEKNKFVWRVAKGCTTLLFALFSFFYLYCMQPDLLACFQYILSDGLTSYSPLVGGLIITVLLVLVGELLAYAWALPMPYVALSYFPSALILAGITLGMPAADGIHIPGEVLAWCVVVLLLGGVGVFLLRKYASFLVQGNYRFTDMWPNVVVLFLFFLFVGGTGNTEETLHDQLKAERLLCREDYRGLVKWRASASHATETCQAIRALALAREHRLGEELFRGPRIAGAASLLVDEDDFLLCDSLEYKFYALWGAKPGEHVRQKPDLFFKMILERNLCDSLDRADIADLYLSSLLLDRKLDRFASEVTAYYPLNDSLPRHYREALVLYKRIRTSPVCVLHDESLEENYNDYLEMSRAQEPAEARRNALQRAFGRTYWFYYNYR